MKWPRYLQAGLWSDGGKDKNRASHILVILLLLLSGGGKTKIEPSFGLNCIESYSDEVSGKKKERRGKRKVGPGS